MTFLSKHTHIHKQGGARGFTLIEMLVAVLIFSVSLVALMTIASRGIRSNRAVANEISAQYLAAEGIEAVRQIRDSNYVIGQNWLSGIDNCIDEACSLELQNSAPYYTLQVCASSAQDSCSNPLNFDDVNTLFGSNAPGDPTVFTRTIYIEKIGSGATPPTGGTPTPADTEIRVISQVEWPQGQIERTLQVREILRDWQQI